MGLFDFKHLRCVRIKFHDSNFIFKTVFIKLLYNTSFLVFLLNYFKYHIPLKVFNINKYFLVVKMPAQVFLCFFYKNLNNQTIQSNIQIFTPLLYLRLKPEAKEISPSFVPRLLIRGQKGGC
jgi:hypothetical protein